VHRETWVRRARKDIKGTKAQLVRRGIRARQVRKVHKELRA